MDEKYKAIKRMDKKEAIKIAKRYLNQIAKKYPIENAIIFGSFAKGTNNPDSDIDLAIIFKSIDDLIDMQIELLTMRSDDDLIIEPHPFAKEDFNISNPMADEIIKNGIEIKDYDD